MGGSTRTTPFVNSKRAAKKVKKPSFVGQVNLDLIRVDKDPTVPPEARFKTWIVRPGGYTFIGTRPWNDCHVGGVSPTSEPVRGLVFITDVVIDVDREELEEIGPPLSQFPIRVFFSGGGWHLHVPVYAWTTEANARKLFNYFREVARSSIPGVDVPAISPWHNIRTVATPSPSTGLIKRYICTNAPFMLIDLERVLELIPEEKPKVQSYEPEIKTFVSKLLIDIWKRGIREGEKRGGITGRNTAAFISATVLRERLDLKKAAAFLLAWNRRNTPPLDEAELWSSARAVFGDLEEDVEPMTEEEYVRTVLSFERSRFAARDQRISEGVPSESVELSRRRGAEINGPQETRRFDSIQSAESAPSRREGERCEVGEGVPRCDYSGSISQRSANGFSGIGSGLLCLRSGKESVQERLESACRLDYPDGGNAKDRREVYSSERYDGQIRAVKEGPKMEGPLTLYTHGDELLVFYSGDQKRSYPVYQALVSPRVYADAEDVIKLKGEGARFINLFRDRLPKKSEDEYAIYSPETTWLILQSMKRGMPVRVNSHRSIGDVGMFAFDIEVVHDGRGMPDPNNPDHRIAVLSLCYYRSGMKPLTEVFIGDEKFLIQKFFEKLQQMRPEIICGHNIFGFDIPYILKRAELHGIRPFPSFDWSFRRRTKRLAERTIEVQELRIAGAEVIDTLVLAQMWDVYYRQLESYGLKEIARALGVAEIDRDIIDRNRIEWYLENDVETLRRYAAFDALEAARVCEALVPPFFELTKFVPVTLSDAIFGGSGQMFDLMLVAHYLERKEALPPRNPAIKQNTGAYTDVFVRGVVRGSVVHGDVASLYPSIMLEHAVAPRNDRLGAFQFYLNDLTRRRLEIKKESKQATPERRRVLDAQSNAMKIIINSAYGMLSFAGAYFRDAEKGEFVAVEGQRVLKTILETIRQLGGRPVQCDTDGVLFLGSREMVEEINKRLREKWSRITFEFEDVYPAVVIWKKKNYVIFKSDGSVVRKGGFFRSRRNEPFIRALIDRVVELIANGAFDEAEREIDRVKRRVENRELTAEEIVTSVAVTEDPEKSGRNLPQYVVGRKIGARVGEKVRFYIRDNGAKTYKLKAYDAAAPIEEFCGNYHVGFYLKKLKTVEKSLRELIILSRNEWSY